MNGREHPNLDAAALGDARTDAHVQAIACPFCHSTDTEPMALFGSQLSTAQYYCRACHTPFERMKQEPPSGR